MICFIIIIFQILGQEISSNCLTITDTAEFVQESKGGTVNLGYTVEPADAENGTTKGPSEPIATKGYLRYVGILCCICASIVFSLATVCLKSMRNYHVFNVALYRSQGVFLPSLCLLLFSIVKTKGGVLREIRPGKEKRNYKYAIFLLFMRGALASVASILQIYSLQYMDIADSTVIVMSAPVFVAFLAHFFLKETIGIVQILVSVTCFCGVVVIARPPFITGGGYDFNALVGAGCASASMTFSAIAYIVIRGLKDVPACLVTTSYGLIGSVVSVSIAFSMGLFELPQTSTDWALASALGLLSFLGQFLFTLALSYEQAGPIAVVRTGDVVFAFIWQYIFLDVRPDIYSIGGSLIIFGGVLLIGVRKWIGMLSEDHPRRRTLRYLLK